ncbi:hypothetical protein N0V88_006347 [Collariella sp. IMI 366227]|nr:hypothetical protein N0V88_006347 [Collariella sp. IMI 366227]
MALLDGNIIGQLHVRGTDEIRYVNSECRYDRKDERWHLGTEGLKRLVYQSASSKDEEPEIPSPHIFESLGGAQAKTAASEEKSEYNGPDVVLPSVAECAVHLELLETFFGLRTKIIKSKELDTVFGVIQVHPVVYRSPNGRSSLKRQPVTLKDPDWKAKRGNKWSYFLALAVARFEKWAHKATQFVIKRDGTELELLYLPPLDILMVWHAFLLNPQSFKKYCHRTGLSLLRQVSFPWKQIQTLHSLRPLASADHAFMTLLHSCAVNQQRHRPLAENVVRQAGFVDKMHRQLWIRSPGCEGTLRRAGERYEAFLDLFRTFPGEMLVPTLDIDLVWHTHQLSAERALEDDEEGVGVEEVARKVARDVQYYRVVEAARRKGLGMLPVVVDEGKNGKA